MSFVVRYSALERLLHRAAFLTGAVQVELAAVEDRLFRDRLRATEVVAPVFITALPRAGTTVLLELLAGLDEFAAQTYRDMPFVLTPLLWRRFARPFARPGTRQERAHGDRMMVGVDSPEALEEVVWKSAFEAHYRGDRIVPWADAPDPDFQRFFTAHIRKVIANSDPDACAPHPRRYVSKNNLNIARLPLLQRLFPDAVILVPFRDPLAQAASLRRQHLNFLDLHDADPFARRYMADLGHYDFGANLRPVDFDGWLDAYRGRGPLSLDFWLAYWTAAYTALLRLAPPNAHFLSYERLCEGAPRALPGLAGLCRVRAVQALAGSGQRLKGSVHAGADSHEAEASPALLAAARSLHHCLLGRCVLRDACGETTP